MFHFREDMYHLEVIISLTAHQANVNHIQSKSVETIMPGCLMFKTAKNIEA